MAPPAPTSADSRQEAAGSAAPAPAETRRKAESERLGTGHGERQYSPTEYTAFERATTVPAEIVTLRYDSLANLLAKGIVPRPKRYADPHPFPGERFVPDPRT